MFIVWYYVTHLKKTLANFFPYFLEDYYTILRIMLVTWYPKLETISLGGAAQDRLQRISKVFLPASCIYIGQFAGLAEQRRPLLLVPDTFQSYSSSFTPHTSQCGELFYSLDKYSIYFTKNIFYVWLHGLFFQMNLFSLPHFYLALFQFLSSFSVTTVA